MKCNVCNRRVIDSLLYKTEHALVYHSDLVFQKAIEHDLPGLSRTLGECIADHLSKMFATKGIDSAKN